MTSYTLSPDEVYSNGKADDMEEYAVLPVEYKVELFTEDIDPRYTFSSFGGWSVEGEFLMVWTVEGMKEGYRIPKDIITIRCKEVARKGLHEGSEDNGDAENTGDSGDTEANTE